MDVNNDYDKALLYTYSCRWDQLLVLMVQTEDEIFSKKIEHFLHAFKYERDLQVVDGKLNQLLQYIDHATEVLH
ncbi:MAG: YhdB family protein [Bacillaceae bacterium]